MSSSLSRLKSLPQVAAAWVLDANGRELVSAKVYPVDHNLDHSDRADFRALQNTNLQTFVWALRARSLDQDRFRPYFTVTRRREGPEGQFRGITIVAVSGKYLASFYNSLLGGPANYTAGIFREDGTRLARYPDDDTADAPILQRSSPLAEGITTGGSQGGLIVTGSLLDRSGQIIAYRRVADYPVYVTVSRTEASVLLEWLTTIRGYIVIGAAAAFGLLLLCLIALRRARREQVALVQVRDSLRDREEAYEALRLAKDEAEVANQAKSDFLATMSHELRTPLNAIIGFSEMILREELGPVGNREYQGFIGDIHGSGMLLLGIINDILDFSKAAAGQIELNESVFDLRKVMQSVAELTAGPIREAGLFQDVSLGDDPMLLRGDERKIKQVLINLIVNSVKFTPAGGRITVSSRFDPLFGLALTVSDTGMGIALHDLSRVLKPFEQVNSSLNRHHQGTGLGLPLAKKIVELHGGRLALSSKLGAGTTATVILPPERVVLGSRSVEHFADHADAR